MVHCDSHQLESSTYRKYFVHICAIYVLEFRDEVAHIMPAVHVCTVVVQTPSAPCSGALCLMCVFHTIEGGIGAVAPRGCVLLVLQFLEALFAYWEAF